MMTARAELHKRQARKSKIKNLNLLNPAIPNIAGIVLRMAGKNLPRKIT